MLINRLTIRAALLIWSLSLGNALARELPYSIINSDTIDGVDFIRKSESNRRLVIEFEDQMHDIARYYSTALDGWMDCLVEIESGSISRVTILVDSSSDSGYESRIVQDMHKIELASGDIGKVILVDRIEFDKNYATRKSNADRKIGVLLGFVLALVTPIVWFALR